MALSSLDKIGLVSAEIFHYNQTRNGQMLTLQMSSRQWKTHADGLTIKPSKYLGPKFFSTQNLLYPNFSWTLIIILDKNKSFDLKKFGFEIFFNSNVFGQKFKASKIPSSTLMLS